MVAYSYKDRFEGPILARTKLQTIRAVGKRRHAREGEEIQNYVRMRQPSCRLVSRERCILSTPIFINFDDATLSFDGRVYAGRTALDEFAKMDGFASWPEMVEFWSAEHFGGQAPSGIFEGVLVRWA